MMEYLPEILLSVLAAVVGLLISIVKWIGAGMLEKMEGIRSELHKISTGHGERIARLEAKG